MSLPTTTTWPPMWGAVLTLYDHTTTDTTYIRRVRNGDAVPIPSLVPGRTYTAEIRLVVGGDSGISSASVTGLASIAVLQAKK